MDTRYQETFKTWNKVARSYEHKFMDLDLYDDTYHAYCESIKKADAKILEIGCGPGNITKQLLSKRPDFKIYGIDIAPKMIALAKKNSPTAQFDVMDGRRIGGLRKTYDGVVCGFCMPYLSLADCDMLINDSYNLLVENGLIYLSFVEGNPENSGFQTSSSGDRVYFYYHALDKIKARLINAEFKEIEVIELDYENSKLEKETHIVLIGRKKITI